MIYIYKDRIIRLEWTILKGTSHVKENFDRALVKLFLIGPADKYLLDATAENGVITATIPQGLPEGNYSVEVIYAKNWGNLRRGDAPTKPMDERFNDRCLMRSRKDDLFGITNYESEADNVGEGEVVVSVKSSVATYGYDGLSVYELAVMRGFNGTESKFLEWAHEGILENVENLLQELKNRDTRFVVKDIAERDALLVNNEAQPINEVQPDGETQPDEEVQPSKRVRAGDEVFVLDEMKAYVLNESEEWELSGGDPIYLEDIDDLEHSEGLLRIADRAIADENGRRIIDHYLTYYAAKNYLTQVYHKLFAENPPYIMNGYITTDMLSEGVKDLLGSMGNVVNMPDEEDLTVGNKVLKLADKRWNPAQASGLGRKMLRKNMVNGVNVLTQEMVSEKNTIYIVQYDFDLREGNIVIPEGCVLDFQGGTITHGNITLNSTKILPNGFDIADYITATVSGKFAKGQCLFDSELGKPKYWNGSAWVVLGE